VLLTAQAVGAVLIALLELVDGYTVTIAWWDTRSTFRQLASLLYRWCQTTLYWLITEANLCQKLAQGSARRWMRTITFPPFSGLILVRYIISRIEKINHESRYIEFALKVSRGNC